MARQRSAKPRTAVRLRSIPQEEKAVPLKVQPFLFFSRIEKVFTDHHKEQSEDAAHDHSEEGPEEFREPECFQVKQHEMMHKNKAY